MTMSVAPPPEGRLTEPEVRELGRGVRAVILSAKFGGGHKSTADALRYWWESSIPEGQISVLDYFDEFVSPFLTNAATIGYTQSVRLFPFG